MAEESPQIKLNNNLVTQIAIIGNELERVNLEFSRVYEKISECSEGHDEEIRDAKRMISENNERIRLLVEKFNEIQQQVSYWNGQIVLMAGIAGFVGFGGVAAIIGALLKVAK